MTQDIEHLRRAFELYARLRERMEDDQIIMPCHPRGSDTQAFYSRRWQRNRDRTRMLERYILGKEVEYDL